MTSQFENHPIRAGEGSEPASRDLGRRLNEWFVEFGAVGIYRTCGNCVYMTQDPDPVACQKFNVVPPISVVLKGCDYHKDNAAVPF